MYKVKIHYNDEFLELLWLSDYDIERITELVLRSQDSRYSFKKLLDMSGFEYTVTQSVTTRNKNIPSIIVQYM